MLNNLLEKINDVYPLTETKDNEFASFNVNGMEFTTKHFEAKGLGSVSIMEAVGMNGAMKMTTLVVNPFVIDAPLFSYDRINAFGQDSCYLEAYNTLIGHAYDEIYLKKSVEGFEDLPDADLGTHWYDSLRIGVSALKKVTSDKSARVDELVYNVVDAYLISLTKAANCDEKAKREKAATYSEGLLTNGGPATDPVKQSLGQEKAERFFRKILFATEK